MMDIDAAMILADRIQQIANNLHQLELIMAIGVIAITLPLWMISFNRNR